MVLKSEDGCALHVLIIRMQQVAGASFKPGRSQMQPAPSQIAFVLLSSDLQVLLAQRWRAAAQLGLWALELQLHP